MKRNKDWKEGKKGKEKEEIIVDRREGGKKKGQER